MGMEVEMVAQGVVVEVGAAVQVGLAVAMMQPPQQMTDQLDKPVVEAEAAAEWQICRPCSGASASSLTQ